MQEEIWKPVVGFEESYEVSNLGNIRSRDRYVEFVNNRVSRTIRRLFMSKLIKTQTDKDGYRMVVLTSADSGRKLTKVHRLVAQAFIENPECKPQVNHINGVKTDNRAENLEWVTNYENRVHAMNNGLHACGERQHNAKLTNSQVSEIKRRLYTGDANIDIARDFGVSHKRISAIKCGTVWKHI